MAINFKWEEYHLLECPKIPVAQVICLYLLSQPFELAIACETNTTDALP